MLVAGWDIKDVQHTSSGRLGGGGLGRVVGYMVTINDILQANCQKRAKDLHISHLHSTNIFDQVEA